MRKNAKTGLAAGVIVGSLASLALADTSGDVQAQLEAMKAEISQLRAQNGELHTLRKEVSELRGNQSATWLNEQRAEEVKALVKEVLADADTRASLMATGAVAGHDGKNFFLASEDGNYLLKVAGRLQVRYIADFRGKTTSSSVSGSPDDNEDGFQIRRMKLFFSGHVGDPRFEYNIVLATDRNTTAAYLEEATAAYKVLDDLKVIAGRYKAPFLHEELISSGKQLTVERSVLNEMFTIGFTEGAGLVYTHDKLRLMGMINDGQNAGEASLNRQPLSGTTLSGNDFQNDTTDLAVTGRADYMIMGNWKQWEDSATWSKDETALFVGGAVHYELAETGSNTAPTANNNKYLSWTADTSFNSGGLSVLAAVMGRHDIKAEPTGAPQFDDYGVEVQAGYMVIPDKFQPFVRYEYIAVDKDRGSAAEPVNMFTGGFNWFFNKHNAKLTVDAVYAFQSLNSLNTLNGTSITGLGLLPDSGNQGDQVTLRAQFQLQF